MIIIFVFTILQTEAIPQTKSPPVTGFKQPIVFRNRPESRQPDVNVKPPVGTSL